LSKQIKNFLTKLESGEKIDSDELLIRIGFYQHERLIHLLVTLAFAIITVVIFIFAPETLPFALLRLLLIGMDIPYIAHYYFLENSVQKLYEFYLISNQGNY
jgi:hypothetical protein